MSEATASGTSTATPPPPEAATPAGVAGVASAPTAPPRPHWAGSLVSLAVTVGVLALLLRLLHVGLPILYPRVLQGPFALADVAEVEQYAGYSPLVPFFRPAELGPRPVHVTVFRRPHPRVVIFWQGEHFLHLDQRRGGDPPAVPSNAEPLPVAGGGRWWRQGHTRYLVLRRGGEWIEIRTDLDDASARRIAETLRPYRELL
jgi:hypothetical protein